MSDGLEISSAQAAIFVKSLMGKSNFYIIG